jgi:hypothetical protein
MGSDMNRLLRLALLFGAFAVVAGCGGGGSGTPEDPGTSSMVPVYVTDAPGDYAQAWVTVKKVEVLGSRGTKAVYQDAVGATFDLVSLNHAGQQRFALLGIADVPAGSNLQVKITVDEKVTLVPTGSTTGTVYTFAGSGGGTKVLTYSAPR